MKTTTLKELGTELSNDLTNSEIEEEDSGNEQRDKSLNNNNDMLIDKDNATEEQETKTSFFSYFALGEEGSSIIQAIGITFGTGILNFPSMINKSGFVPSLIMFILCSAAQQYTLNLLVSSSVNRKKYDYFELTEDTKGNHWAKGYAICSTIFMIITIMGYNQAMTEFINHIWLVFTRKDIDNYKNRFVCLQDEENGKQQGHGIDAIPEIIIMIVLTIVEMGMVFYKSKAKVYYLSIIEGVIISITGLIIIIGALALYHSNWKNIFEIINNQYYLDLIYLNFLFI